MTIIKDFEKLIWLLVIIGVVCLIGLMIIKAIKNKFFNDLPIRKKKSNKINATLKGSGLIKTDSGKGFIFGKINKKEVVLNNDKEGHITIFGGSGKGKTSALLIPSLRAWHSPFFAIDISGDISKNVINVGKEDDTLETIVLSPDNPEESYLYNIFHAIDSTVSSEEKREKLEQLVYLIVDIPSNSGDAQMYFLSTARKIFLGAMIGFYDIGMDFIDICKTVFFNDINQLAELIEETHNPLASSYISPLTKENEKNISGAKNTLNEKLKLFADNEKMQKIIKRPIVDFDDNSEPCLYPEMIERSKIFLKVPDKKQEFFAPFMHIVVGQMLEYISNRVYNPNIDKRILLALDEFASIGHFEILSPFRKFRKNGANLCILTQSLADIDLVYSEKERQVILDNSQYVVVLSANDNSTREYFSNLVGREDVKNISTSSGGHGTSTSTSTQREYAINPEEWKTYDRKLIVIHPSGYTKLKKNYYFEEDKKKNRRKQNA